MIIKMNAILKQNTSHSKDPEYNIGGFKIKDKLYLIDTIKTEQDIYQKNVKNYF